jgi:hypothetical protein
LFALVEAAVVISKIKLAGGKLGCTETRLKVTCVLGIPPKCRGLEPAIVSVCLLASPIERPEETILPRFALIATLVRGIDRNGSDVITVVVNTELEKAS